MNAPVITPTKSSRRWLQFNLRTGFILLTLVGLLLGAALQWRRSAFWEEALALELEARGAKITMDSYAPTGSFAWALPVQVPCIATLTLEGDKFTDADLKRLSKLEHVEYFALNDTAITLISLEKAIQHGREPYARESPSVEIYANCDANAYECAFIYLRDFERALQWQLAVARHLKQLDIELKGYRQCLDNLRKVPSPRRTTTALTSGLYLAKTTSVEMRLAICEQNDAEAIRLGTSWQAKARDLREAAIPETIEYEDLGDFILATQLAREIKCQTARLAGDRKSELQAADEAFAAFAAMLKRVLSPQEADSPRRQDKWASTLAIALEWERNHRRQIAGESLSQASGQAWQDRVRLARAECVACFCYDRFDVRVPSFLIALEQSNELLADARHSEPAQSDDFDQQYSEFLRHSSSLVDNLLHNTRRYGKPVWDLTCVEANAIFAGPINLEWLKLNVPPRLHDWQKEYEQELKSIANSAQ